ncbi:glycosyltransferase family A protein [uncultured Bacteroides sp.]|uniref:glycosyltransferase family 2 protein n=1 Tax=uncultured Bacteroides sp. TaxID=162156 RepID=UPI00262EAE88|nr:glycosyltransferase family A protein [uncultured Bacteroides sp.]
MIKISIIVPVYNREKFLENCVKSLLAQTFKSFEIWLIDDGSADGSGELCDRLAEEDKRIHVVHIKNSGVSYARRVGVLRASGEWITFVDSDDTLPVDALQRLYLATCLDTDLVIGFSRNKKIWGKRVLSPIRYRKLLIEGRHNISAPWGKLIRKTLFNEKTLSIPRNIVMGEDMLMNIRLAFASSKPVRLVGGKSVYNYVQHGDNITHIFKIAIEYMYLFHQERLHSIPEQSIPLYMHVLIHRRLRMLRRLLRRIRNVDERNAMRKSAFISELLQDIRKTHYSFLRYPYPSVWRFLQVF